MFVLALTFALFGSNERAFMAVAGSLEQVWYLIVPIPLALALLSLYAEMLYVEQHGITQTHLLTRPALFVLLATLFFLIVSLMS